ncbi:hypothetical protein RCZ04_04260 [Capnocytophaga sp. HP1101]
MTIQVNGKPAEAYHLIMKKENALDILKGTKKVEMRTFSDKYLSMFIDQEKYKEYQEKLKEPDFQGIDENGVLEFDKVYRDDIRHIFFTNYNKTWNLVVELDGITTCSMVKDDIEFLAKNFDFHDYDNEWQQFEGKDLDEIPAFFALVISKVVSHEGL